jgi:hypothetical protein
VRRAYSVSGVEFHLLKIQRTKPVVCESCVILT